MGLLRRIVVVSKKAQIHGIAQETAQEVFAADDLSEAAELVTTVAPDLVVFDGTVAPSDLHRCLEAIADDANQPRVTAVLASDEDSFDEREYKRAGISHCLMGEESHHRLCDIAAEISEDAQRRLKLEKEDHDRDYYLDDVAASVGMVGHSPATDRTMHMIKLIAASQCNPVLVVGDTGTGKEVAARALHTLRHPGEPFVAVNCAALTATLLESELFGHVRGAFTGADRDKTGLLEMAGGGTIFLDEISEMPLDLQAKLLRVLQERTFRRVGGLKDLTCSATIMASSNRDLKKEVREKRFRQDLYYRLNVCPIRLAPLRSPERRQDIELLAHYFLATSSICAPKQDQITSITKLAMEALRRHDWPGNARELRNVIERAILLETTDKIGLDSIIIDPIESDETMNPSSGERLKDFSLQKAERELIARALHETGWQKTLAASMLGITRATLYAKVKQYNIRKDDPATEAAEAAAPSLSEAETAATC